MTQPLEPARPEPDVAEVVEERFGHIEDVVAEQDAASYVWDMADGVD